MRLLVSATLAFVALAAPALAKDCGVFPPGIQQETFYSGYSDCELKAIGEPSLWTGLPERMRQVLRFTFTQGHLAFVRTVRIEQAQDGTVTLLTAGTDWRRSSSARKKHKAVIIKLSAEEMATIEQMIANADLFRFERESWDGDGIYMHCQTLDMERVNADGYRMSTVNIGCNHPESLMPLVNEVARLAGLKVTGDGMLYF